MTDNRFTAYKLLRGYMAQVYHAAGLRWDGDNDAEMKDLIDSIIDAAKDAMQPRGNPSLDQALNEGDGVYRP